MNITGIKIRKLIPDHESKMKAVASVTFDNAFVVHDIKIVEGIERTFIAMPSHRSEDGRFQDVVHPINQEARSQLEAAVMAAYNKAVADSIVESEA